MALAPPSYNKNMHKILKKRKMKKKGVNNLNGVRENETYRLIIGTHFTVETTDVTT